MRAGVCLPPRVVFPLALASMPAATATLSHRAAARLNCMRAPVASAAFLLRLLQAHEADSKARRHPTPWAYIRSLAWVRC